MTAPGYRAIYSRIIVPLTVPALTVVAVFVVHRLVNCFRNAICSTIRTSSMALALATSAVGSVWRTGSWPPVLSHDTARALLLRRTSSSADSSVGMG
ncbi:MAG: hypothetical protein WKH64_08150 [Chloroflexia bacterium]